jgi:uncharacterized membrane protein YuzA (DUF378 family)
MAINRSGIPVRGLVNYGIVRVFFGSLSGRQQVFLYYILLHRNHLAVIYCLFYYIPVSKKNKILQRQLKFKQA